MNTNYKSINFIIQKIWILHFLFSVLLIAIAFFFKGYEVDIQFHDTYFVINFLHIGFVLTFCHLAIGLCYIIMNRRLNLPELLKIFHSLGSIGLSTMLIITILLFNNEDYFDNIDIDNRSENFTDLLMLIISFISLQIIMILVCISFSYKKYIKKRANMAKRDILDA